MVFGQQIARQVSHANPDCRLVQRRDEDCGAAGGEPHKSRRTAPGGSPQFAFIHEPKIAQHRQAVGDHRAAKLAVPFKFLPRAGCACADEVQQFDQRRRSSFHCARTPLAPLAGRFAEGSVIRGQRRFLAGFGKG